MVYKEHQAKEELHLPLCLLSRLYTRLTLFFPEKGGEVRNKFAV